MTLHSYLEGADAGSLTAIAEKVGISIARLSQLRRSVEWPADLALRVEEATSGCVDASAISPVVARARKSRAA